MNDELSRLETQLRLAMEGPAWHGPALLELVAGVSATDAYAHPIPGAHSIWEIVLHLSSTYRLVLRRLTGDARQLTVAEDWPLVPAPDEAEWRNAVDALRTLNEAMREAVRAFPPAALDRQIVDEPAYPAYVQFIGLTQHDLYHAGQIALLKRALAGRAPTA